MTPPPPPGVYRISQSGDFEQPQILSLFEGGQVTVLPLNAVPEKEQEVHFAF